MHPCCRRSTAAYMDDEEYRERLDGYSKHGMDLSLIHIFRFMTSHPKDLSDELIEVMKHSKKICKHLHLPVQSGSTEILKKMNRRYTKEQYLELVRKIKEAVQMCIRDRCTSLNLTVFGLHADF